MKVEIINGNKSIAEFIRIPKCDRCDDCSHYKFGHGNYWLPESMKYSTSWDWLMTVVEKISKHYDVKITYMPTALDVTYIDRPETEDGEISSMGGMTAIENTYFAVIKFIEWYNKQPKYYKENKFKQ